MKTYTVLGEGKNKKVLEGIEIEQHSGKKFFRVGNSNNPKKMVFVSYNDMELLIGADQKVYHADVITSNSNTKLLVFPQDFQNNKVLVLWKIPYDPNVRLRFFSPEKINIIMAAHQRGEKMNRLDIFAELGVYQPLICKRIASSKLDYLLEVIYYNGEEIKVQVV